MPASAASAPPTAQFALAIRSGDHYLLNGAKTFITNGINADLIIVAVKTDPGEKTNVADKHPEVVKELDTAYDKWWDVAQPGMANEDAIGPKVNPFKELYEKQFGAKP